VAAGLGLGFGLSSSRTGLLGLLLLGLFGLLAMLPQSSDPGSR
jgi:hypothetical protein